MFVHLAKRIAMPGETAVTKCGWNPVDGYVSAGCADGLVKVLKLEIPDSTNALLSFPCLIAYFFLLPLQLAMHALGVLLVKLN
jgi:hypothetical protein